MLRRPRPVLRLTLADIEPQAGAGKRSDEAEACLSKCLVYTEMVSEDPRLQHIPPRRCDRVACQVRRKSREKRRWRDSLATHERILIDAHICHGKPVVRGTRVPVVVIVGSLAGGMSFEEIEAEYDLTREDIRAALAFTSELLREESFYPLPGAA